jgi:hypothetical protein
LDPALILVFPLMANPLPFPVFLIPVFILLVRLLVLSTPMVPFTILWGSRSLRAVINTITGNEKSAIMFRPVRKIAVQDTVMPEILSTKSKKLRRNQKKKPKLEHSLQMSRETRSSCLCSLPKIAC